MRRIWKYMLLALLLTACSTAPQSTQPTQSTVPNATINDLAVGPITSQPVVITAPIIVQQGSAQLASGLNVLGTPKAVNPALTVRINGVPSADLMQQGAAEYGIVRAVGIVEEANNQRTFQASEVKVLSPTAVLLRDLVNNSSVYQEQVVQVNGTIIVNEQEALLVEAVGSGGVPTADAAQIKVAQPFSDRELISRLPGQSNNVRYGSVVAVGLWRNKSLQIFWLQPA